MPHNLTVTPTAPGNVPVPDPGDARTAASVIQFAQPLANSIGYLQNQSPGAHGSSGVQINFGNSVTIGLIRGTATDAWQLVGSVFVLLQHDNTLNQPRVCDVTGILPPGVTVTGVLPFINGNYLVQAAHGALPTTKPKVTFAEVNAAGTVSYSVNASDNPASVPAYEANHMLAGTGLTVNRIVSNIARYVIVLEGERDANSAPDYLAYLGVSVNWTAP